MKIYLVRHGEARKTAQGGDSARPLSDQGRDEVSRMASFLGRSIRVTRSIAASCVPTKQP
jgi:phosphohistidine phosphatase SixA